MIKTKDKTKRKYLQHKSQVKSQSLTYKELSTYDQSAKSTFAEKYKSLEKQAKDTN
jgi:hypothetical protein